MKDDGHIYFQLMHKNAGTTIVPDHYACTIVICGRLGTIVEAKEILDQMVVELYVIIWKAFMAAYIVYGNKETILPTHSKNWDLGGTNCFFHAKGPLQFYNSNNGIRLCGRST